MKEIRRSLLSSAVLSAFGAAATLGSLPAVAQQQQLEKIEVTGSNIRRVDAETASPVQILSREQIEQSGKGSVAEFLQTLAVDNQGSVPTTFGNGFAAGASGLSLRGLGSSSTLVLVNGRRVAPYGLADDGQKVFTDVNLIPLEAVERVEILKDGASAIYGSDAIGGVVNVILRKDFSGIVAKASYGTSRYGDGTEKKVALTAGFGSLATDKWNVLVNAEFNQKGQIWYRDRVGRGTVGKGDLLDEGYGLTGNFYSAAGYIAGTNVASSAVNGNVRDPATLEYYNRGNPAIPGYTGTYNLLRANCANFSTLAADPGGGCRSDLSRDYSQIQPKEENYNIFVRGTWALSAATQAYGEANIYRSKSVSSGTPSGVSGSTGYPGGPVSNAAVALGAAHPDNPFFGSAARLRYIAADVGPRVSNIDSSFYRFVAGLKGSLGAWDYDTALLYSENQVANDRTGFLQRNVAFALLNPTAGNVAAAQTSAAYAALPAGTYWRIGENANLNSAALYAALSPTISNDAKSSVAQVDFKASTELFTLPGGPAGLALGAELRREASRLDPTTGTDTGNIIGLGYSAYDGSRTVSAVYAETLLPVIKSLEVTAAIRFDRYSDAGNSTTPKIGFKYNPVSMFALRGTFAKGFRAPNPAENGRGGLAFFTSADDPLRCALGVTTACDPASVAGITSPNPDLKPEKSDNFSLGVLLEPTASTSLSVDYWQIKRKNEINQESTEAAIAAGRVARDPSTASVPGDPGAIVAVLINYVNSAKTTVKGLDLDFRQRFDLGGNGKLTFGANWTHLYKWERTEASGDVFDYAGTHGNCDVTNCIGTPADRANFSLTWDRGGWSVATVVNYRASIENRDYKGADCATTFDDGSDAPNGCKIGSFTTFDLSAKWQALPKLQVFGSIRNLFDKRPPVDPHTYGAVSYNPLDYSGAVGRFFTLGAKYTF